jgi:hypothetical protein
MKKLITIVLIALAGIVSAAELTLSEKSALAESQLFRARIFQALNSKANFWRASTPTNLKQYKQRVYALKFLTGGQNSIDIHATARFWLANYNTANPVLDGNNQPTDLEILEGAGLDVVFDLLAGVVSGDELLPIP